MCYINIALRKKKVLGEGEREKVRECEMEKGGVVTEWGWVQIRNSTIHYLHDSDYNS